MLAEPRREMTLEEWADLDEEVEGELVDGVLVEEEMPASEHDVLVTWLVRVVGNWLSDRRDGFVFPSGLKYGVRSRTGRIPDVSVFLAGRRPPARGVVRVPPDIAVEIISPTARDARRDRIEKLADYAAFGVRWYWLVDPQARALEILELGADGRYAHAAAAMDARLDVVPGCEGLVLDVPALWAEIDRLAGA